MAPVSLDRYGFGQRIHGVEDDQVGFGKKLDERFVLPRVVQLVFGVGGVNDGALQAVKTESVGVAGVVLQFGCDVEAVDVVGLVRRHQLKLDAGTCLCVVDREVRGLHLLADRLFQLRVAAVHHDAVARDVHGGEIREAHQVIPVQMGNEDVIGLRICHAELRHLGLAERAGAATHVADEMLGAVADDFDARRVAAKGAADGERQGVDELVEGGVILECLSVGRDQGTDDLLANVAASQCNRQGAACSPENDLVHAPRALQAASTVAWQGTIRLKRLMANTSCTIGWRAAMAKTPCCTLARREAIISTRNPALLM